MVRPPLLVLALVSVVHAEGLALSSQASVGSDDGPSFTWSVTKEDIAISLGWSDPECLLPAFGLVTPFCAAGRLKAEGLPREVARPLAFGADSPVFQEETGMMPAGPATDHTIGYLCTPLPGLGLIAMPAGRRGMCLGMYSSETPITWLDSDQFLSWSRLVTGSTGEEWFPSTIPFPGGEILHAACRIGVKLPRLCAEALAACSLAERAPPGALVQVQALVQGGALDVALLGGAVAGEFHSLAGDGCTTRWRAASSARVHAGKNSLHASWAMNIRRPGLSPRASLPETETFSASWTRTEELSRKVRCTVTAKTEKEVTFTAESLRSEEASVSGAVALALESVGITCRIAWSHGTGLQPSALLELSPAPAVGLTLEAESNGACAGLRLKGDGRVVTVGVGARDARPEISVAWKTQFEPKP